MNIKEKEKMRPIERIDDFLKKVDWNDLLYNRWKLDKEIYYDKKIAYAIKPTVPEYWKENPDQRIGQVLINMQLVPNDIMIWHAEEPDILMSQGIALEECLYWTSMYNKDEKVLDEPITRKVSSLTKEHIIRIVEFMKEHNGKLSPEMEQAFTNVLMKE